MCFGYETLSCSGCRRYILHQGRAFVAEHREGKLAATCSLYLNAPGKGVHITVNDYLAVVTANG